MELVVMPIQYGKPEDRDLQSDCYKNLKCHRYGTIYTWKIRHWKERSKKQS